MRFPRGTLRAKTSERVRSAGRKFTPSCGSELAATEVTGSLIEDQRTIATRPRSEPEPPPRVRAGPMPVVFADRVSLLPEVLVLLPGSYALLRPWCCSPSVTAGLRRGRFGFDLPLLVWGRKSWCPGWGGALERSPAGRMLGLE
jgi:hypothetical protein